MKKTNNKGFTLVELIVVLVILAILAAILVPALLGYIDKAREKQITTNAEAAYVAAQATMTERYGKNNTTQLTGGSNAATDPVQILTDIQASYTYTATYKSGATNSQHDYYIIETFTYVQDGKYAKWYKNGSNANSNGDSVGAGGWIVVSSESELPTSK